MDLTISPDDIRSIDDITKLPFTTKQDLRDNYPYGLMAALLQRWCVYMLLPVQRVTRRLVGYTSRLVHLVGSDVTLLVGIRSDP